MKYLITGCHGFVGKYMIDYIKNGESDSEIFGLDIIDKPDDLLNLSQYYKVNLLEKDKIQEILSAIQPDYIIHLASFSSVGYSWNFPKESFINNTNIFLNLIETIRTLIPKCKILSIGSSEEYGNVSNDNIPITESCPLNPISPYAVARVSQEHLSMVYFKGYNINIVCTRSFNHIGPGQSDKFVISSIIKKMCEIKKFNKNELWVGNIDIIRDFLDVRDVVRAYYLLLKNGKSGEVYNICSGKGYSIRQIIDFVKEILNINFEIKVDPNILRPTENKIVIGSNEKINKEIGWIPTYNIETTLNDVITYWYNNIK